MMCVPPPKKKSKNKELFEELYYTHYVRLSHLGEVIWLQP